MITTRDIPKEIKMKLIPIGARTIIKPFEVEDKKTDSGIIITAAVQDKHADTGTVVASDKYKPGQIVFFSPYAYTQITVDNKKLFVLYTEEILGIVQGAK